MEDLCPYHQPNWWEKHPRADHPELKGAFPIFDFILWQTPQETGLYRTLSYCPHLIGDYEKEQQINKLTIYLTDALIRAMVQMEIIEPMDEKTFAECKRKIMGDRGLH